ncbi:MAG TPA: hypothetical protein VGI77_12070 [Gaiellaceae bacterium]
MPRLSLTYPNGRTHEVDSDVAQRFDLGDEFDLYGRRWLVVSTETAGGTRYGRRTPGLIGCRALTASTLPSRHDDAPVG